LSYPVRFVYLDSMAGYNVGRIGPQPYEEAISFANWDVFWYTRGFPSMDTERSRRHASKLLTYPLTIGSVLHQHSNLTLSNQRVTPEGARSLAGELYLRVYVLLVS
jgi:splicing suppressor protein 51